MLFLRTFQYTFDMFLLLFERAYPFLQHVMIVRNHLLGNLKASISDEKITLTVKDTLKLIDVLLIDHLRTIENGYFSFLIKDSRNIKYQTQEMS